MSTSRATSAPVLLLAGVALSCSSASVTGDAAPRAERQPDAPALADASPDLCKPSCHYDCFHGGGTECQKGNVYELVGGARPCCKPTDPWPDDKPICAGSVLTTCKGGTCGALDPRYGYCVRGLGRVTEEHKHLVALYCPETRLAKPGDECVVDADCRPAAASVSTALRCNPSTLVCELAPRPAAPPGYGLPCGLSRKDVGFATYSQDAAMTGKACEVCHVAWLPQTSCFKQACTIRCKLDEDCPAGASCVCIVNGLSDVQQICATATERTTVEGRVAAIACEAGPDAGSASDGGKKDRGVE